MIAQRRLLLARSQTGDEGINIRPPRRLASLAVWSRPASSAVVRKAVMITVVVIVSCRRCVVVLLLRR